MTPDSRQVTSSVIGSIAEWLFAMFPLVVVAIVTAYIGHSSLLLKSPEWAFGAAILSAQALFRFVGGIARARRIALDRVLLGVAVILVAVVGPANVVLVLVVISDLNERTTARGGLSDGLIVSQAIFFVLASALFIVLAAVANLWNQRTAG